MKRIALVGDYNEGIVAHRAIPIALHMAVSALKAQVSWEWVHSQALQSPVAAKLESFAGVWCVPGSPYGHTQGVIDAIRFARLRPLPFLGTCGGFQHALLEYAQAEWGVEAQHAETTPNATDPLIAPLVCPLVEVQGQLHLERDSRLAKIYGCDKVTEGYHCSYGFNPHYLQHLTAGPLHIAARDDEGGVRAVELQGHPFFVATLFQPERAALRDKVPPLVKAFVAAVV